MRRGNRLLISAISGLIVVLSACKKENSDSQLHLRGADGSVAGTIQQVNVELLGAEAYITGTGWISIPLPAGVYNLRQFVNGLDTLFVNTDIPAGQLTEFRLLPGKANSIVVNQVLYPLQLSPETASGLVVNVNEAITDAETTVLFLDFDAARSVTKNNSGDYILNPVMRGFNAAKTGAITGDFVTCGPNCIVEAQAGGQLFTAVVDRRSGHFILRGLPPGNYSLRLVSHNTAANIGEVLVATNSLVDLGALPAAMASFASLK